MKELNQKELGTLKELANIGVNSSATTLGQMIGKQVSLISPQIKLINVEQVKDDLKDVEAVYASVYIPVFKKASAVLIAFPNDSGLKLVDIMRKKKPGTTTVFDEMDVSAFNELGNILVGAYLSAVANFLHIKADQGLPHSAVDMIGSVLDATIVPIAVTSNKVLVTDADFSVDNEIVEAKFYFLFEPDVVLGLLKKVRKLL